MIEVGVQCVLPGEIIAGIWIQLSVVPTIADTIELTDTLSVIVISRRFTPDGVLWLKVMPVNFSAVTIAKIKETFDSLRD